MARSALRSAPPLAAAVLLVAAIGCTGGGEEDPPPTESPATETDAELDYYTIPTDPCSVADLTGLETMLGPTESTGPDYGDEEEESISVSGDTYCDVRYHDGTNETWVYLSIELLREPAGEAAGQDPNHDFGHWWSYTSDDADENLESVPDPVAIPVETAWESSQVLHFIEVSDDRLTWDPEGSGLALIGTFTESNVAVKIALTREGFDEPETPEPDEAAEAMVDLAEQIRPSLGPVP
ncbi:hypothetical protein [Glycomyces xiaoerkulensis]|uniref:hypothetical protein n=1 Tax=Glycomyces xiaoerkulensis TaxID=2038139 RepID=UPI000C25F9DF|nr:hypothetical protein [Glycomyces xiaoerkulensis]